MPFAETLGGKALIGLGTVAAGLVIGASMTNRDGSQYTHHSYGPDYIDRPTSQAAALDSIKHQREMATLCAWLGYGALGTGLVLREAPGVLAAVMGGFAAGMSTGIILRLRGADEQLDATPAALLPKYTAPGAPATTRTYGTMFGPPRLGLTRYDASTTAVPPADARAIDPNRLGLFEDMIGVRADVSIAGGSTSPLPSESDLWSLQHLGS